jgi:hypothetical protein
MSIRVVLSCNGREGAYDCRQATPVGEVPSANEARKVAANSGWTYHTVWSKDRALNVLDFCPACTKRQELNRTTVLICGHTQYPHHPCSCQVGKAA